MESEAGRGRQRQAQAQAHASTVPNVTLQPEEGGANGDRKPSLGGLAGTGPEQGGGGVAGPPLGGGELSKLWRGPQP